MNGIANGGLFVVCSRFYWRAQCFLPFGRSFLEYLNGLMIASILSLYSLEKCEVCVIDCSLLQYVVPLL
jgi:hypothetical protein